MALTAADKKLFQEMAADGLTKEQAIAEFKKVKLQTLSPTVAAVLPTISRAAGEMKQDAAQQAQAQVAGRSTGVARPEGVVQEGDKIVEAPKGYATPEAMGMTGEGYGGINKDNLIGAAKSVPDTILGASEAIQGLASPITEAITGSAIDTERPEALKAISEPTNEDQQEGMTAGQIAQFFVPVGGAIKGGEKLTKGASLLQKILSSPTTAKVIKEGSQFGGLAAAQEGEVNGTAITSGVIGGAFPLLGKLSEPVAKFVSEKIPSKLMNSLIKTPSKEFSFGKNPGLAIANEGLSGKNISELATNIGNKKNEVGKLISESAKSGTGKGNAEEVINKVTQEFTSDLTDPQVAAIYQGKLDQLFHDVKFESGKLIPKLDAEGNVIAKNLTSMSGEDLHKLQQKIGELTTWSGQAYDKPVNKVLSKMYYEVGKVLEQVSPGTKELQQKYANLLGAQKSIEKKIASLQSAAQTGLLDLGAFGIGAGLFGGDSTDKGIAGILAALLRRGAGSTLVKSNVSKGLKGLEEKTIPATIKSAIKTGAASLPSALSKDSQ